MLAGVSAMCMRPLRVRRDGVLLTCRFSDSHSLHLKPGFPDPLTDDPGREYLMSINALRHSISATVRCLGNRRTGRQALAVVGAFVALVACGPAPNGDANNAGGATPASSPAASDNSSPTGQPTDTGTPNTAPATSTAGNGPTLDPRGPDLQLYTLPECTVVPGGALSGADGLTIFVAIRNGGPGTFSRLVPWEMSSDTGLSAHGNSAISTGSAFTAMQTDLRSGDFNRTHRFTIKADPGNQIVERNESNNTVAITVTLPTRPIRAADVPCTSP
jgi:hypothetical protein